MVSFASSDDKPSDVMQPRLGAVFFVPRPRWILVVQPGARTMPPARIRSPNRSAPRVGARASRCSGRSVGPKDAHAALERGVVVILARVGGERSSGTRPVPHGEP
jgi:hypothetical protein